MFEPHPHPELAVPHSEFSGPLFILKQSLYVAHAGLRLTEIGLPLPVLGLKAHATNPSPYLSQASVATWVSLHHENTTRLVVGILVGSIFLTPSERSLN